MGRLDGVASLKEDGTIDGETWLVEHLKEQLEIGVNPILMCVGPPRSGKSYATMRLLERARNLQVEDIVFPVEEFVETVRRKNRGAIMCDDFGTGMSAREWQSIYNRVGGLIFQSFGYKNILTGITVPDQELVDSQPRRLYTVYVQMYPRTQEGPTRGKVYLVEHNPRVQTTYTSRPILKVEETAIVTLIDVGFGMPSEGLWRPYELKKRTFLDSLYEDLLADLKSVEVVGKRSDPVRDRMVLLLVKFGERLGFNQREVADQLDVHPQAFYRAVRRAEARRVGGTASAPAPVAPATLDAA